MAPYIFIYKDFFSTLLFTLIKKKRKQKEPLSDQRLLEVQIGYPAVDFPTLLVPLPLVLSQCPLLLPQCVPACNLGKHFLPQPKALPAIRSPAPYRPHQSGDQRGSQGTKHPHSKDKLRNWHLDLKPFQTSLRKQLTTAKTTCHHQGPDIPPCQVTNIPT